MGGERVGGGGVDRETGGGHASLARAEGQKHLEVDGG